MLSLQHVKQTIPWRQHASDMHWGQRLKAERVADGLTQEDLTSVCGVTKAAASQWENGGGIRPENLFRIADKLGVDARWLATGKGTRTSRGAPASELEAELLEIYRALSGRSKSFLIQDARKYISAEVIEAKAAETVSI